MLKTLSEMRKELKQLGCKILTKKTSFGLTMDFVRYSDGAKLPTIFSSHEHLKGWQEIIDYCNDNEEDLKEIRRLK